MEHCKKCILPENYPNIFFNEKGVCNFCLDYKPKKILGKDKLVKLISSVTKGNRSEYDCIVPISGGKDSTYVLYYVVKELKLKTLAINFDNGFQSPIAKENIKNACKILKVPLIIKKADVKIQKKILKEGLQIAKIVGTIFRICPEIYWWGIEANSIKVARQNNIPLLFGGFAFEQESNSCRVFKKIGFIRKIVKLNLLRSTKILMHLTKYYFYNIHQKVKMGAPIEYFIEILNRSYFTFIFNESYLAHKILNKRKPKCIQLYDYVRSNPPKTNKLLKNTLKWKHPKNEMSRFDCFLDSLNNYRSLQLFNISQVGDEYCNYIRKGIMSRQEALEKEGYIKDSVNQKCKKVIEQIGLIDYEMPKKYFLYDEFHALNKNPKKKVNQKIFK